LKSDGMKMDEMQLAQMDEYWEKAKLNISSEKK
jgi:uncharacterized protein YabN with tetrapyrrole methylase and pyrophosphatase domain